MTPAYATFLASKSLRVKERGLVFNGRQYWKKSTSDRFWGKVIPEPNSGCWLWLGATSQGYGVFGLGNGVNVRAHCFSYEVERGPIPNGLDLDHLCRIRCCVNPDHLEPVTRAVNVARGLAPSLINNFWRSKTHCPKGHAYTGENLAVRRNGARYCRECRRSEWRAWKARQK